MNKTRLYIHIGTHKTGSTAIQHALRQNRYALKEERLVYLSLPDDIIPLVAAEELNRELIRSFRRELSRQVMDNQKKGEKDVRFLMSWEGFSGNPLNGYRNAGIVADHLKEATDNMDVCIIVYLRRQDDFFESLYTQRIQKGESYSFQSFVETHSISSFNWERLLRCYSDRFGKGNIVARRYDKSFFPESSSLLKDFLHIVGIDLRKIIPDSDIPLPNRGYSRDALEIARLSNPFLNEDEKMRLRHILQQTCHKQPFESYSFWNCEKRDALLARYSESNAIVAKEYFNESSGVLFPFSDIYRENQVDHKLSLETVTLVLVKAMVAQQKTKAEPIIIRVFVKAERKVIALLGKFPWLKAKLQNLLRMLGI